MKRIISSIVIASFIFAPLFSQNDDKIDKLENLENKNNKESTKDTMSVVIGDKVFSVRDTGDETRITLGKKEYRVVEDNDGVTVYKSDKRDQDKEFYHRRNDRFRGHLGGMEFGFNGFLTDFWSTSLAPENNYFDLNTAKSNAWNFLFPSLNLGITRHMGFVTTIGLNYNKYRFDGNNSLAKDADGVVGPYYPDPSITYLRTRLATTYATLPLLFEIQLPVNGSHHNTLNFGAGVIGAVKLGSHTKVVYESDGKQKEKIRDDYSLNVFRWGYTARVGYENLQIYGTAYMTKLFEKGKGPELNPFELGIAFTFN
ncbi:MAG TPA: outer membrane beta-barrel protein [Bacteroidales bacterium]|nr:outer membrane beta-barrel protein [Bacteroidales bacterium]